MRILQVVDDYPPCIAGDGIHVYEISNELAKLGHDVTVFTNAHSIGSPYLYREKNHPVPLQHANMFEPGGQRRTDLVKVRHFHPLFRASYFSFSAQLCKAVLEENFDIIHIHRYFSLQSSPTMFASKLKRTPVFFTPHSATTREQKGVLATIVKGTFDCTFGRYLIRSPDILIALTQDNIRDFLGLGARADGIKLVPDGIDLEKFTQLPSPDAFKNRFDITGDIVLFVGRLVKYKGVQYLLRIAPRILREFPRTKFVIVGPDFGYGNELLKLVSTYSLQESVIFTGAISESELLEAYSAADVLAFPSIHEGFGLVLLEAMACGKPAVTWKTSAMQYVIEDRKSGFLVDPWNLDDFARSIILLISDKTLAGKMGESGRKAVEEKFEWKSVVKKLEATYREAIAS